MCIRDRFKEDLRRYWDYLLHQVRDSTIDVRLNETATPETVENLKPDALILALGAEPVQPRIEGAEHAVQALAVIENPKLAKRRCVIIGGGTIGCELGQMCIRDRGRSGCLRSYDCGTRPQFVCQRRGTNGVFQI